jgi:3' terminal RNA ribose 2'-O-methyltransferase Hen1
VTSDLHEERLETVVAALLRSGAQSVLDLGCGPGELLIRLARQAQFQKIIGIDLSLEALLAAQALVQAPLDEVGPRVSLLQASFTRPDARLEGFDAAALVETIEHIDPGRLSRLEHAVFSCYRPATVIVTTPNREYNVLHGMAEGALRHPDHRFEWDRTRFRGWAFGVARRNGYAVQFQEIGEADPLLGASTQMAVFTRAQESRIGSHAT